MSLLLGRSCTSADDIFAVPQVEDPDRRESRKYQNAMTWEGPPSFKDLQDSRDRVKHVEKSAVEYADSWRTARTAISDDALLPLGGETYRMPIELG